MRARRDTWLPILFLTLALLFATGEDFLSDKVQATGGDIYKDLELFSQILRRVESDYVEDVDPHKLIMAGIDGMLEALDPHTQFLDTDQYGNLMVSTQGSFGGLGIVIAVRDGVLTVISPMEGTPAYAMGIQGGDKILKIDGESTEGLSSDDAVKKLRGPKGTKVTISIAREGVEGLLDYTITRDIIELHSVPYAFMMPGTDGIGYIRCSQFMKTTTDDLEAALQKLEAQGMKGLVLDLRRNPGGLLDQAVSVSDLFLDKGEMITFTKGRKRSASNDFIDENNSTHSGYPLIVMVERGSASASEIVAGAIQDWDRGLIVGTNTFGKGSVQSVLPLTKDTGLKLTTAKYYTPVGRSIHKDEHQITVLKEEPPDSLRDAHPEFKTKGGRTVRGGGGIEPDIIIEQDKLTKLAENLERNSLFFEYAISYVGKHKEIGQDFEVSGDMLSEFKKLAESKEIEFTDDEYDADREYIEMGIRREVFRKQFGDEAAYKTGLALDKQLREAVQLFGQAATLKDMFALAEVKRDSLEASGALRMPAEGTAHHTIDQEEDEDEEE
jgi:carboxyl-terminal processing protease